MLRQISALLVLTAGIALGSTLAAPQTIAPDPTGWQMYCDGYVYCVPFVSPTAIVSDTATPSRTPTRTPSVTPTMVTPALPTVTATGTPTIAPTATSGSGEFCSGGALTCTVQEYRRFEVIAPVSLCFNRAAPCYGTDRFLRLIGVGEIRQVWCVYQIAPGNVWASEFKCDAAFDVSWNAIIYGGKRYMVQIAP